MHALDLAEPQPLVTPATTVSAAVRLMVQHGLPGLVVTGPDGSARNVLPGWLLLRLTLPPWVRDDPGLAGALPAAAADDVWRAAGVRTLADVAPAPPDPDDLPLVPGRATSLQVAAVLSRTRSPLVGVVEGGPVRRGVALGGRVVGVLTATRLLTHLVDRPPA